MSKVEELEKRVEWLELQMDLVHRTFDKIDRKTENSSEKSNNSTISKMEQVEPQTNCGDFANRLAYERGVKHAWEVAQKVFDSTVTFYEAEDVAKQIDKDINVRSKTEPQKDFLVTEYPQDGEVNLIGRDKTEAVVMAYDVYKELTEPWAGYKKWDAPPKADLSKERRIEWALKK